MQSTDRELRMLLVSASPERVDKIRKLLQKHALRAELFAVRPGRKAFAMARGDGRLSVAKAQDVVLLDCADPDEHCLTRISEIAFGRVRGQAPIVMLTSRESEELLRAGPYSDAASQLFEPMGLIRFVDKMCEHARERFLHALEVIGAFGPVLVRLPGFVANDDLNRGAGITPQKVA